MFGAVQSSFCCIWEHVVNVTSLCLARQMKSLCHNSTMMADIFTIPQTGPRGWWGLKHRHHEPQKGHAKWCGCNWGDCDWNELECRCRRVGQWELQACRHFPSEYIYNVCEVHAFVHSCACVCPVGVFVLCVTCMYLSGCVYMHCRVGLCSFRSLAHVWCVCKFVYVSTPV